jgi:hypothetical protein
MEQNKISVSVDKTNPAVLRVAAFTANGIRVPASAHDLTDYQGETFRLYMEESGDLSSCKHCDHYWLLLEGNIPSKQTETIPTGEKDEKGQEKTTTVEVPLDLSGVTFRTYDLPTKEENND